MGNTTPIKKRRSAPVPAQSISAQGVLEEAAEIALQHKTQVDRMDLGGHIDIALTKSDPDERKACLASFKLLYELKRYEWLTEIEAPLGQLRAATASGNKAAAAKAAANLADGLDNLAQIDPEFKAKLEGLEKRVTTLETDVKALKDNDKIQDKDIETLKGDVKALQETVKRLEANSTTPPPATAPLPVTATVPKEKQSFLQKVKNAFVGDESYWRQSDGSRNTPAANGTNPKE